jgi:hypothetical protein
MEHRRMSDKEMESVVTADGATRVDSRAVERENGKKSEEHAIPDVRATDIEPYTGLRYLSKLFKLMAVVLMLLLIAEVVTGLSTQGSLAIPTLLGEASRLLVLSGLLWGTGDMAHLLIDVGHDVRAGRILLARQVHHMTGGKGPARLTGPVITTPTSTVTQTGASGGSSDRL